MFVRNAPAHVFLSFGVAAACMCVIAAVANGSPLPSPQEGLASVYAKHFNGKSTASGEHYDSRALTAAHRTLPLGTEIRVTNLENGKSVRVRINDRGPHVRGRIVDLSSSAAAALGFSTGVAQVRIEILSPPLMAIEMRPGTIDDSSLYRRLDRRLIATAATDAPSIVMIIPSCNSAASSPSTRCGLLCST